VSVIEQKKIVANFSIRRGKNCHAREEVGMQPIIIGDLTLTPKGPTLHIAIAEHQGETAWTVYGAREALAYLQAWLAHREREAAGLTPESLDSTGISTCGVPYIPVAQR
jgi:hypothetical protein